MKDEAGAIFLVDAVAMIEIISQISHIHMHMYIISYHIILCYIIYVKSYYVTLYVV